ncbi:protein FAM200A [Trichonephila clavipes]|nr:protein FAM200A [Trichonephila clavipes]
MVFNHCMIHRKALVAKDMDEELHNILQDAVSSINYIKCNSLNSRLFSILCNEYAQRMKDYCYTTEVRWFSCGKILRQIFDLRNEVYMFLSEKKHRLVSYYTNEVWVGKQSYLVDIFEKLKDLNLSLRAGQKKNDSYQQLVKEFLQKFHDLGCNMTLNIHFSYFHLDPPKNCKASTDSTEKKNSDERPPKKSEDSSNKAHSSSNPHKSKYIPTIEDLIIPQESDKDFHEIPELGKHYSETWPLEDLKEEMIEGSKSVENNKGLFSDSAQDHTEIEPILKLGEDESSSMEGKDEASLYDKLVCSLISESLMTHSDNTLCPKKIYAPRRNQATITKLGKNVVW